VVPQIVELSSLKRLVDSIVLNAHRVPADAVFVSASNQLESQMRSGGVQTHGSQLAWGKAGQALILSGGVRSCRELLAPYLTL